MNYHFYRLNPNPDPSERKKYVESFEGSLVLDCQIEPGTLITFKGEEAVVRCVQTSSKKPGEAEIYFVNKKEWEAKNGQLSTRG